MKIENLPSSDVLVPVLFLVPEVLVLGRPLDIYDCRKLHSVNYDMHYLSELMLGLKL